MQGFLRADFHEDPRAGFIQSAQAFHELHGRRDLPGEKIQHLRNNIRPCGIELAIYVGNDGQARRFHMQARKLQP